MNKIKSPYQPAPHLQNMNTSYTVQSVEYPTQNVSTSPTYDQVTQSIRHFTVSLSPSEYRLSENAQCYEDPESSLALATIFASE